jgi:hypothetical protein
LEDSPGKQKSLHYIHFHWDVFMELNWTGAKLGPNITGWFLLINLKVLDNYLILDFSMFVMFVIVIGNSIAIYGAWWDVMCFGEWLSLASQHFHLTYSTFLCDRRTFEIYSFSNWNMQAMITNCSHDAVQYISRTHASCLTETVYPLFNSSPSHPTLAT